MKYLLGAVTMALVLVGGNRAGAAHANAPNANQADAAGQKNASDTSVKKTDKQLALQAQTDRLVVMATELKDQVDKTNKNILSIKVVQKAEEIEQFAKRLKEQNKK